MPKSTGNVTVLRPGRREANKGEKLTRIRRAAKEVFLSKGFEAATVREIAAAADVAFGTLFLYAKDKQDLLLLLFDEELPALDESAFRKALINMPFIEQLMAYFTELFIYFSATPQLSRDMLREITFSGGIVSRRMWVSIQGIERHLAMIVARAQADDRVSSAIAPDLIAHIIFSLYRVEIRFCLDDDTPDVQGSVDRLRRQLEVLFTGLDAHQPPGLEKRPASHIQTKARQSRSAKHKFRIRTEDPGKK